MRAWLLPVVLLIGCAQAIPRAASAQPPGAAAPLRLENEHCLVEVEPVHGSIIRFQDRQGGVDLAPPLGLAESFRLLLDLGGGERRWVLGKAQTLSRSRLQAGELTLEWDGPLLDTAGETHDIPVTLSVRLADEGAEFVLRLENRSPRQVAEAWYPLIGGLARFGPDGSQHEAALRHPPFEKPLAPPSGDFMVVYPGQLQMGFVDLNNPKLNRGLYLGAHDRLARLKGFRVFETRNGGQADTMAGLVHFPRVRPGERFEGAPAVFRFHPGGWREAGNIYRRWFIDTFGIKDPATDWIRRQTFFQMTMFLLPEGNINYTFRDIPRWARDARDYGVRAVQIAGWQRGGHDNGYPYYEPDPRLGTWGDLEAGIRACHAMGMKVFFFVNIQPAMLDLEWYRRELRGYVAETPRGDPWWIAGWGMGTLASRIGQTVPRMAFLDPAFPEYRAILLRYFRKLAAIGADGVHIDKMFPASQDFNPRAPLGPDRAPWEGAIQTLAAIARECQAIHPGFAISNECNWDRVLSYGTATWWAGNMSTARQVFPEVLETVGHYQPYDRIGINNAVRMGWAVMVAPHQFNRSMAFRPWRGLSAYIREVKRIRDALLETVFLGEFLDKAEVTLAAAAPDPAVDFATFRNRRTGRRACILTNSGSSAHTRTLREFAGRPGGRARILRPFARPLPVRLPADVTIPAEGIAFVVEE